MHTTAHTNSYTFHISQLTKRLPHPTLTSAVLALNEQHSRGAYTCVGTLTLHKTDQHRSPANEAAQLVSRIWSTEQLAHLHPRTLERVLPDLVHLSGSHEAPRETLARCGEEWPPLHHHPQPTRHDHHNHHSLPETSNIFLQPITVNEAACHLMGVPHSSLPPPPPHTMSPPSQQASAAATWLAQQLSQSVSSSQSSHQLLQPLAGTAASITCPAPKQRPSSNFGSDPNNSSLHALIAEAAAQMLHHTAAQGTVHTPCIHVVVKYCAFVVL